MACPERTRWITSPTTTMLPKWFSHLPHRRDAAVAAGINWTDCLDQVWDSRSWRATTGNCCETFQPERAQSASTYRCFRVSGFLSGVSRTDGTPRPVGDRDAATCSLGSRCCKMVRGCASTKQPDTGCASALRGLGVREVRGESRIRRALIGLPDWREAPRLPRRAPSERETASHSFIVDVVLHAEIREAGRTDDLDRTVDYPRSLTSLWLRSPVNH